MDLLRSTLFPKEPNMADDTEPSHGPQSTFLQSKDHGELLDVIDILRAQGISRYISLPQLVVCGDQSSGKSSVLEAVSGVRFPTKDNLCTRFATELILRRDREEKVTVTIMPGAESTESEIKKLREFQTSMTSMDGIPALIRRAEEAMGLGAATKAFSEHVLKVEISGPEQPHLTLVDLPGLIHAENRQQSAADVKLVSSLVRTYMANTRSIILAVVSAKNDYANQIVTTIAREVDPSGLRTLGIITKPDTLPVGSESEKAFFDLAKNEDVVFRLGWHVLMNRDYISRECSLEKRNEAEKRFFSHGIWTSLPLNFLGVRALTARLSTVLKDQIIRELPKLIGDLEVGIEECRSRLTNLGEARTTFPEQQLYLIRISHAFNSLVKDAVNGDYVHDFFALTEGGHSKRLRATIQNLLSDFSKKMCLEGHNQEIADGFGKLGSPSKISRSDYTKHVQELMRHSRGRELPGTFNPLIIRELFYEQSKPWKQLVGLCCESILAAVEFCVESVINRTTDDFTKDALLREIIDPAMADRKERLDVKIAEIMKPHLEGHPITFDRYFTDTILEARQEHTRKNQEKNLNTFFGLAPGTKGVEVKAKFSTSEFLDALAQRSRKDMDEFACSEATDCMLAYYKVALKVLVDNVAVLGIEQCLLSELADIFSPRVVAELSEQTIQEIAAETEDVQAERRRLKDKLCVLEAGLKTLNRLKRHRSAVHEQVHPPSPKPPKADSSSPDSIERAIPKRHENGRKSDRGSTSSLLSGWDSPTPQPRHPAERSSRKSSADQSPESTLSVESASPLSAKTEVTTPKEEATPDVGVYDPSPKWGLGNTDDLDGISKYPENEYPEKKKKAKVRLPASRAVRE